MRIFSSHYTSSHATIVLDLGPVVSSSGVATASRIHTVKEGITTSVLVLTVGSGCLKLQIGAKQDNVHPMDGLKTEVATISREPAEGANPVDLDFLLNNLN